MLQVEPILAHYESCWPVELYFNNLVRNHIGGLRRKGRKEKKRAGIEGCKVSNCQLDGCPIRSESYVTLTWFVSYV